MTRVRSLVPPRCSSPAAWPSPSPSRRRPRHRTFGSSASTTSRRARRISAGPQAGRPVHRVRRPPRRTPRNPLTGRDELNGTSILDVTRAPARRAIWPTSRAAGEAEEGGARWCACATVRAAARRQEQDVRSSGRWAISRTRSGTSAIPPGGAGHHDRRGPQADAQELVGVRHRHRLPRLRRRPAGWRTNRMTKIYDLGDPARPHFIRDFGLTGQEPARRGPRRGVHGPIARAANRVYFAYGTGSKGVCRRSSTARSCSPAIPRRQHRSSRRP